MMWRAPTIAAGIIGLLAVACGTDRGAITHATSDGLSTELWKDGKVVASLEWSRASGEGTVRIDGVTNGTVRAPNLDESSADALLQKAYDQVSTTVASRTHARNGYVTCSVQGDIDEEECQCLCDEWTMYGMMCSGCVFVASDCSTKVVYSCGQ